MVWLAPSLPRYISLLASSLQQSVDTFRSFLGHFLVSPSHPDATDASDSLLERPTLKLSHTPLSFKLDIQELYQTLCRLVRWF
ncbi:hypothetical protein OG21DRAFT_1509980 [Imleria badia]|nr:hypothetical protein OG21DRAFT_1509980 [Imleria badia]